jgi:hypothetical protein
MAQACFQERSFMASTPQRTRARFCCTKGWSITRRPSASLALRANTTTSS